MFNKIFNLFDEKEEEILKEKMVKLLKININFVNFVKISIQSDEYVHVLMIDDFTIKNKPNLVLLHGLTGTSFCFFKMLKLLSKYFTIYALDLPGQGLSSRIEYDFQKIEKAEEYFLFRFKKTFDSLNLDKFILLSHSFSGYLSGLFYLKYPHMITQLIFISPIGLCSDLGILKPCNFIKNLVYSMAFKFKRPPNIGIKLFGIFSYPIFNKYCERSNFKGLNDEEYQIYTDFLYSQIKKNYCSDSVIYSLFDKNLKAYKPLSLFIDEFRNVPTKKIFIVYGDQDWNPINVGEEFKNILSNDIVEISIISCSGHMISTDNYSELNEKILEFLEKLNFIKRDKKNEK